MGCLLWFSCIGIALKKRFPLLSVYLSDCSEQAVFLAEHNARTNGVEVTCLKGDLLSPFYGKKANYFICNPPYISENEYVVLEEEVKAYEPRLALTPGKTGLEIYERLSKDLPNYLYPQAKVWLEIGYQQGGAVQKIFQDFFWKRQRVENDWAGHHRFFFLEIE